MPAGGDGGVGAPVLLAGGAGEFANPAQREVVGLDSEGNVPKVSAEPAGTAETAGALRELVLRRIQGEPAAAAEPLCVRCGRSGHRAACSHGEARSGDKEAPLILRRE